MSLWKKIQANCNSLLKKNNINEEPIIVFIVHEPPTKKCSERIVLMQWLQDNGIEVQEFAKEENQQLSLFNGNPPT